MSRHRRPPAPVRAMIATLGEHGYSADVDLSGGGHFKIRWSANGRRRLFIIAKTRQATTAPSTTRAPS
jgi:hypothetical protein